MPAKIVEDQELIELFKKYGSPKRIAEILKVDVGTIYRRRHNLQTKQNLVLPSFNAKQKCVVRGVVSENRRIFNCDIADGQVFIASDAHYWPGESTVAHLAFIKLLKKYKPQTIIMNGDVFDGARISRHEPLYGTNPPTVKDEISACEDRLNEIANASPNATKIWTLGNHDIRIFRSLSVKNPELVETVDLFSYFPGWKVVWMININDNVVVKHRWHNGLHSTYNNTLRSGKTIVTGHLHQLKITPWSDYNGRRYGVDTGTLAEPYGDQFVYTEGNPVNWCSGFAVLTFKNGMLLPPELCEVIDGKAYFRGEEV